MGKTKLNGGWYISHQDRTEHYDSQQAALLAVDSILASYESGIWSDKSYFFLGHQDRETVDTSLFDGRYSTGVLTRSNIGNMFTIDIYIKNKEDWIFQYGSDLLQQSLRAGYDCNEGYLAERLSRDYPGFTAKEWSKYKKVDTPSKKCLRACDYYEYSYCSNDKKDYYITIDNYLGRYQLVKFIDPNLKITKVEFPIKVIDSAITGTDDKEEWIFEHGSDLLQQSLMAGYDCKDRYLQERIAVDYPGFTVNPRNYPKVDSPDESCLYACLGYEGSYCSSNNKSYYITIDNFLGKYQLIKQINPPLKIAEGSSIIETAINNSFITKISRYRVPNNSSLVVIAASTSTFLVGLFTILYVIYIVRLNV
jgi:hypothetical protein